MKILTPISNPLDLILSAATAVAVHAVLLGYGAGFFLERSPAPIIQSVHEAECISMLPIKKAPREKVRTLQQEPEKVPQTNRDEILDRELSSKRIPQIPEHRSLAAPRDSAQKKRIEEPAKHREKVPQVVREKVLKPDETWLKENEAQSNSSVALSNHPSPVLDRGWKPLYPEKAKRNNWEGRVELMLTISPQGRVIDARLHQSSGFAVLDESMIEQIKSIPFQPARSQAGVPIEWRGTWGWNYNLEAENDLF